MKKNTTITLAVVLILIVIAIFVIQTRKDSTQTVEDLDMDPKKTTQESSSDLDPAPDFSLKDYDGNIVSLSDFSGKALVINSWATWCPFCVKEIPDFVTVQKEFADEVVIIAINRRESQERAKKFLITLESKDGLLYLDDPTDSFYKSIGGLSMPETLFINNDGEIVEHRRGIIELEDMRDLIRKTINSS